MYLLQNPTDFPDGSLDGAENYCRNPAGVNDEPYCFTVDPSVRQDKCDLPKCIGKKYCQA